MRYSVVMYYQFVDLFNVKFSDLAAWIETHNVRLLYILPLKILICGFITI